MILWLFLGVLAIIVLYAISIFNQLTRKRILVQEGWSGVGTFLQQRNDVIPNMVEIVNGYAGHENKTLNEVTRWRNQSAQASSVQEQNEASQGLNKALLDFYSVSEQYPDLKANQNFLHLQEELSEIETKINQSRRYFNGTVREYNQGRAVFPQNMLAGIFGFRPEAFFLEDEAARTAPQIRF